jgi:hypothetical protein
MCEKQNRGISEHESVSNEISIISISQMIINMRYDKQVAMADDDVYNPEENDILINMY